MKYLLIVAFFSLVQTCSMSAQELMVKSVELFTQDASASTNPRVDTEGNFCALLKISLVSKNAQFRGDVVGRVENKKNEYWVYMKRGSRFIEIQVPSYKPLRLEFKDSGIKSLQSKTTYGIVLSAVNTNVTSSTTLSFEECKAAVLSESAEALVNLGKCYLYGIGTSESPSNAVKLFDKAAQKGSAEATYLMGNSYFYGLGNPRNYKIAYKYYQKAAKAEHAPSLYALGVCFEQGKGVEKNEKEASKYIQMAAKLGYQKAITKMNNPK